LLQINLQLLTINIIIIVFMIKDKILNKVLEKKKMFIFQLVVNIEWAVKGLNIHLNKVN
jgi:hypothetical protein